MLTPEENQLIMMIANDHRENSSKMDELIKSVNALINSTTAANERDKLYMHRIDKLEERQEKITDIQTEQTKQIEQLSGHTEANTEHRRNTTRALITMAGILITALIIGGVTLTRVPTTNVQTQQ